VDLPDLDRAIGFIRQGDDFLLTSHVNSDGDAIGACLALQGLVRQTGRSAIVVLPDPPDPHYDFLAGWPQIQPAAAAPSQQHGCTVVLDCPHRSRIGLAEGHIAPGGALLNVDHHPDNSAFGSVNLVTPAASSTCEIVYQLALGMGLQIDAEMAAQLYTGIIFDTGGFRYSLATAATLEVGADLVRHGARLDAIADRVFNDRTFAEVRQLGQALHTLALHCGGRVVTMHLTFDQLRSGDPEDVVNHGLSIRGVEAAILLRENAPGQFRVSLRSRDRINVSEVARLFGGGGHPSAAGCRLDGALEEVQLRLLEAIGQRLR
jgi:bifunctional oligoribonuclease and PAP phosphatase NrnA